MANNAGPPPIKFQQLLQLTQLGINQDAIKFTNITIESDRCVVVREANKISIVDTSTRNVTPLNVTVDSAIMNPSTNVLGLRSNNNLQIFNLDMRTRMKTTEANDAVLYWRWLDSRTIAYVTAKAVYHWSMDGDAEPEKKFDIVPEERQVQIIGYDASADNNWLFLQGIAKSATDNSIEGVLQLYNVPLNRYQPKMNAHGGCFAHLNINGRDATLFCFTKKDGMATKLFVVEVGNQDNPLRVQSEINFQQQNDFIVAMVPASKYGCIYAISQQGTLFLYDIQTGRHIFSRRVSNTTMFLSVPHTETGGVVTLDRSGRVALFHVDRDNYVPYITSTVGDAKLGVTIATKFDLPGAGNIFKTRFEQLIAQGQYQQAAKLAADAPQGVLRTPETIQKFQAAPNVGNGPPADLQYYTFLLQKGPLNKAESIGLCQRILQFRPNEGKAKIERFLREQKLENSEELGDLLARHDPKLAASVFYKAKVPAKTILCFIQLGQSSKIVQYCKTENYTPKWGDLLGHVQRLKRDDVKGFAQQLVEENYLSAQEIVNVLLGSGRNDVEKTTEFLLDYLQTRGDREEDAELQTKLLEINLRAAPQVAEAILESEDYTFSHYDKNYVARLCESARLFHQALKHYENLDDIKRVLQMGLGTNTLTADFLLKFFGDLTPEDALSCLRDLLQYQESGANLQLVVEVAKRYTEQLTPEKLIGLFEEFDCWSGLYLYLGNMVNYTQDSKIIFKYIVAAAEVGQFAQIELICRENDHYDADEVKAFLLESNKIKDPRPLIHVCDRHGYIDELTNYLYTNQMYKFIEVYVQRMNQAATPKVVGALLDLNAPEDQIRNLVNTVRPPQCPIDELVEEVEKRVRLTLLLPWLETRFHEGLEDASLHNALAKIYIDINNNPQHFLMTNKFYESEVVGKYCESRDPHMAFLCYKRAWGKCDKQLVEITNKHGFFKDQARYCVERQDADLWGMVLAEENEHRRSLIDQVVATALPESRKPDEVSSTVKAFMNADLPNELIELLERIVLSNSAEYNFRNNKNLQNLLILTAIKADPTRVAGYIDSLDNYDGPDLAKICISETYKLYEEGFLIYKKFDRGVEAINVLLYDLKDIQRGQEFAAYWDKPQVWSILGRAQLDNDLIQEAIESFLKADDAQHYQDVILSVNKYNKVELYQELIKFLTMARSKVRDKAVDSELIYSYAKVEDLASLEKFISNPHSAILDKVGDRLFDESLFASAKIIFTQISNYAKLASCLVRLQQYQEAVDAARKANSIQTWKDVCYACVDAHKFRLAQMCGVNIIVFMDHLHDLIRHYEIGGHFAELVNLLEQGINLDRAHQGIYTQLGILYAKYKEIKLMEHINLFWSRLNIPTLLQACKDNLHWKETVFLYTHYDQYDNAADTMIQHSPSCWDHEQFKGIIVRVSNTEVFYRAINFYLREHPLFLSELLIELSPKLDHKRVVQTIRLSRQLPLIQQYLLHVQRDNISVVNEAVNELLVEEENFAQLRDSIADYDAFDQIALAQQLQKHELLEFRRIAAHLYRTNKRWTTSIALSKQDGLWQDAMETAALSQDSNLAEELLRFFVENIKKDACPKSCFAACLFTCYELIRPDIVLELAWRYGLVEFCMPYMVQTFRTFNDKLDTLYQKIEIQEKKIEDDAKAQEEAKNEQINRAANTLAGGRLMLTGPGAMPQANPFGGAAPPTANPYGAGGQFGGMAPAQPNPYSGGAANFGAGSGGMFG